MYQHFRNSNTTRVSPTNDPTAVKTVKDIESKKVAFSINVYEIRKIDIEVTITVDI